MVRAPFAMAVVLTAAILLGPFDLQDWSFGSVLLAQGAAATIPSAAEIAVTEAGGIYRVTAKFTVPAPPGGVAAVLTDYERIPEFMPDVKTSQVLERSDAGLVVEQEAAATFLMFSKRIHLVLDVNEDRGLIRFRDRCKKSFEQYEGAWRLSATGGGTTVLYELAAKPAFDVPAFVLKRLFKRDAAAMIDRLQKEIVSRAATR